MNGWCRNSQYAYSGDVERGQYRIRKIFQKTSQERLTFAPNFGTM